MSLRLAGSARVVITAVSIGLGAAACGSADEPAVVQSDPTVVVDTSPPRDAPSATDAPTTTSPAETTSASTSGTAVAEPGVSEAEVTELEQQLDEIDRVLADLEVQLSED